VSNSTPYEITVPGDQRLVVTDIVVLPGCSLYCSTAWFEIRTASSVLFSFTMGSSTAMFPGSFIQKFTGLAFLPGETIRITTHASSGAYQHVVLVSGYFEPM
jgi:hypothetical protein